MLLAIYHSLFEFNKSMRNPPSSIYAQHISKKNNLTIASILEAVELIASVLVMVPPTIQKASAQITSRQE